MLIVKAQCMGCGDTFPDRLGGNRLLCTLCAAKAERLSRGHNLSEEAARSHGSAPKASDRPEAAEWRICGACGRWVGSAGGTASECGVCAGGRQ